nr:hypothetical protein OG781_43555 [Streptomyces sp. NBC_00830]
MSPGRDRWDRRGAGAVLRIIEPADGKPRRLLFGWDESAGRWELDSTNPRDRGEFPDGCRPVALRTVSGLAGNLG